MPKVSLIIPTYNRAQFVGVALESVLAQTLQDFEIIIVDDGSTDGTKAVVDGFGDRVRYVWQPNKGRCRARNVGIDLAAGDYLVFLDSDDIILPHKLEMQARFLDEHPDVGVVYSDLYFCDSTGNDLGLYSQYQQGRQFSGDVFGHLIEGNFVPIHAAMVRKSCVVAAGGFDETLLTQEDWDLWIRVAQTHAFAYLSGPVGKYRIHANMTVHDARRIIAGDVAVRQKVMAYPFFEKLSPESRCRFYYTFARLHCAVGDMAQGRHFFRQVLALNPKHLRSYALLALSLFGQKIYRLMVFSKRARWDRPILLSDHW